MAQANSIQREPSMEEILASIRRIIEDSDTARKQVDESEEAAARLAVEPDQQAAIEVEAFREGLKPADDDGFARLANMPQIQAEVARQEPAARQSWPQPFAPAEPESAEPEDERAYESDPADPGEADFSADAYPAEEPVSAENQNPRPAILSDHAGRQIAASFEELSEAFAASRRKSFDEMAEDMMRPMLQDWLDNNLPLLVERLVREEIERVARGGAR